MHQPHSFWKFLDFKLCWKLDLTPRLTWEHWIYGNYNGFPRPAEFLSNTRQRLHVNVIALSLFVLFVVGVRFTLSYIQNDYFLCKSMNEIRATGTYTCHVPQNWEDRGEEESGRDGCKFTSITTQFRCNCNFILLKYYLFYCTHLSLGR